MTDAEKIKKIREITGLSGTKFAEEIGAGGPSTILNYEKNLSPVSKTVWLAIEYRFGHLFQWVEEKDGTKYVEAKPQEPPTTKEQNESELYGNPPVSILNRKLNKLFETLPANIQMGVVSAIETYISTMPESADKNKVEEAYDDFKKTYMEEELRKMG